MLTESFEIMSAEHLLFWGSGVVGVKGHKIIQIPKKPGDPFKISAEKLLPVKLSDSEKTHKISYLLHKIYEIL